MRAPHTERLEQPQLVGKKGRLAPEQTGSAGLTYEDMINVNQSDSCPFQYSYICHVVERDFLPEVAFDVPERSCDWVHNFSRQHDASISTGLICRFDRYCGPLPVRRGLISVARDRYFFVALPRVRLARRRTFRGSRRSPCSLWCEARWSARPSDQLESFSTHQGEIASS